MSRHRYLRLRCLRYGCPGEVGVIPSPSSPSTSNYGILLTLVNPEGDIQIDCDDVTYGVGPRPVYPRRTLIRLGPTFQGAKWWLSYPPEPLGAGERPDKGIGTLPRACSTGVLPKRLTLHVTDAPARSPERPRPSLVRRQVRSRGHPVGRHVGRAPAFRAWNRLSSSHADHARRRTARASTFSNPLYYRPLFFASVSFDHCRYLPCKTSPRLLAPDLRGSGPEDRRGRGIRDRDWERRCVGGTRRGREGPRGGEK